MIEVDARGLSCPEPVMLTHQALTQHPGEKICAYVDEACALPNVRKFLTAKGKNISVTEKSNGEYKIDIR